MLTKLLFINIAVFLVLRLSSIILTLAGLDPTPILHYFEVPSDPTMLLYRPWTIITYMFGHYEIFHILFNMLWLYWFGQIFLMVLNARQMLALYLYGGIAGALLYILAYNTMPFFAGHQSWLIGASASVIAIVIATAMRHPNYTLNLLFFGPISLKWIAIVTIAIDLLSITGSNAGGHIAHIGGGIMGFMFAYMLNRGTDITVPLNSAIDSVVNSLKRIKRPTQVKAKKQQTHGQTYTSQQNARESDRNNLDEILDKIKKSGYSALTPEERKRLFDISRRIK